MLPPCVVVWTAAADSPKSMHSATGFQCDRDPPATDESDSASPFWQPPALGRLQFAARARRKKSSTCCRSGSAGAALFSPAPAAPQARWCRCRRRAWQLARLRHPCLLLRFGDLPHHPKNQKQKDRQDLDQIVEPGGQDCCVEDCIAMPHAARSSGLSSHSTLASAPVRSRLRSHHAYSYRPARSAACNNRECRACRCGMPRPSPRGTSASASTSFARFSSILAMFSCSCDTAIARLAFGRRSEDAQCRPRPDRPAAGRRCCRRRRYRRCRSTRFRTPFANRACGPAPPSKCGPDSRARLLCVSAEPIALTMPSPTRATIVSSVAPPMS